MNCKKCNLLSDILNIHKSLTDEIYKFIIFHVYINSNWAIEMSNEKNIKYCFEYINFIPKRRNRRKFNVCDMFIRQHKRLISSLHIILLGRTSINELVSI